MARHHDRSHEADELRQLASGPLKKRGGCLVGEFRPGATALLGLNGHALASQGEKSSDDGVPMAIETVPLVGFLAVARP